MIHCTNCKQNEARLVSPLSEMLCDDCSDAYLMGQANPDASSDAIRNSDEAECLQCLARPACQLVYIDGEPQLLCQSCWMAFLVGQRNPAVQLKEILSFLAGEHREVEGYQTWFITAVFDTERAIYYIDPQPIAEATQ